jgi:hypothetical protein
MFTLYIDGIRKSRTMEIEGGRASRKGDIRTVYKVVSKSERWRRKWEYGLESDGLGVGPETDCCESGNEPPFPSEADNFLTSYKLLMKDSASWIFF